MKNHYETAFCSWLEDNHCRFSSVSQSKRLAVTDASVKSFDYIIDTSKESYLVELKGRSFKGSSLENLSSLQNWVTADDVLSLEAWQSVFAKGVGVFVFCYYLKNYFADLDGWDSIDLGIDKYAFMAVRIDDYKSLMQLRSAKWKTVYLRADDFKKCVFKLSSLILNI